MIYIINFGSRKTPYISQMVTSLGYDNKVFKWDETDGMDLEEADGLILSGSPTFLTEVSHVPYHERYGFIRETVKPVLGICFGHQVVGILHGAQIYRGKEVEGTIEIKLLKDDPLFAGLENPTVMAEDHTEGIDVPEGFVHLATSSLYPNEGMKHRTKKIYSVQFHPEVSGENGKILFGNFCKMCC
jgi:GMP synthase (glutamine-hydrolysing)